MHCPAASWEVIPRESIRDTPHWCQGGRVLSDFGLIATGPQSDEEGHDRSPAVQGGCSPAFADVRKRRDYLRFVSKKVHTFAHASSLAVAFAFSVPPMAMPPAPIERAGASRLGPARRCPAPS